MSAVISQNPMPLPAQAAPPVLQPGTVVQGLVLSLIENMTLRVQIPGGTLDVAGAPAFPPGTRVQVAVEGTPAQPRILLTPLPAQSGQELPRPANAPDPFPNTNAAAGAAAKTLPTVAAAQAPLAPKAPTAVKDLMQALVTGMVRDAATRQDGLAPLYADLQAALARPGLQLPPVLRAVVMQLLGLRLDPAQGVVADNVKTALLRSGLFSQAGAQGATPAQAATANPQAADVKMALLALRQALKDWIADEKPLGAAKLLPQMPQPQTAPRAAIPTPPFRDAPTTAQPVMPSTLPEDATPREIGTQLLAGTEAALARHRLLQIASQPDQSDIQRNESAGQKLTFDIPLATPAGTGVAQLRIEQDGRREQDGELRPLWRAQFSIDVEPIGPVHAQVALIGGRASITLLAERKESAQHLRESLGLLETGLKEAALDPGELVCRNARPAPPSVAPGLFVDQAS